MEQKDPKVIHFTNTSIKSTFQCIAKPRSITFLQSFSLRRSFHLSTLSQFSRHGVSPHREKTNLTSSSAGLAGWLAGIEKLVTTANSSTNPNGHRAPLDPHNPGESSPLGYTRKLVIVVVPIPTADCHLSARADYGNGINHATFCARSLYLSPALGLLPSTSDVVAGSGSIVFPQLAARRHSRAEHYHHSDLPPAGTNELFFHRRRFRG